MTILVSVQQEVAAWQIPALQVERLRQTCPEHAVIHATAPDERAAGLGVCDVAFTWILATDELRSATRLRWLHSPAVAVGTLCLDALARRGVLVSNSRGIQATPIAEHVFASLLALTRRLPLALDRQRQAVWAQNEFTDGQLPDVLRGSCLGVIGLGSIGAEVARLGAAFGMDVVGLRRDPSRAVTGPGGFRLHDRTRTT